jgi:hypothetical protein
VKVTTASGDIKKLVDSSSTKSPKKQKTFMTVGTWDGSDPSVFYAGSGASKIYRVDASESPTVVSNPSNGVGAVVDIGDIDGDSDTELVFVDGSQQVRYLNRDGTIVKLNNAGVGSNNALGAGELIQYNGKTWILIVDGSQNIALVTDDGGNQKRTVLSNSAVKAPITVADVDDDEDTEIVYIDKSSKKLRYVNNPLRGNQTTEPLLDADGNKIRVRPDTGVVSP